MVGCLQDIYEPLEVEEYSWPFKPKELQSKTFLNL